MAKEKDSRTEAEREIDDRYDEMILRTLGPDAIDPEFDNRGHVVVDDGSGLGYQHYEPLSTEEERDQVEIARAAVNRSYEQIPVVDGE